MTVSASASVDFVANRSRGADDAANPDGSTDSRGRRMFCICGSHVFQRLRPACAHFAEASRSWLFQHRALAAALLSIVIFSCNNQILKFLGTGGSASPLMSFFLAHIGGILFLPFVDWELLGCRREGARELRTWGSERTARRRLSQQVAVEAATPREMADPGEFAGKATTNTKTSSSRRQIAKAEFDRSSASSRASSIDKSTLPEFEISDDNGRDESNGRQSSPQSSAIDSPGGIPLLREGTEPPVSYSSTPRRSQTSATTSADHVGNHDQVGDSRTCCGKHRNFWLTCAFAVYSLILNYFYNYLFIIATFRIDVGQASAIMLSNIAWASIAERALWGHKIPWVRGIGIAMNLTGGAFTATRFGTAIGSSGSSSEKATYTDSYPQAQLVGSILAAVAAVGGAAFHLSCNYGFKYFIERNSGVVEASSTTLSTSSTSTSPSSLGHAISIRDEEHESRNVRSREASSSSSAAVSASNSDRLDSDTNGGEEVARKQFRFTLAFQGLMSMWSVVVILPMIFLLDSLGWEKIVWPGNSNPSPKAGTRKLAALAELEPGYDEAPPVHNASWTPLSVLGAEYSWFLLLMYFFLAFIVSLLNLYVLSAGMKASSMGLVMALCGPLGVLSDVVVRGWQTMYLSQVCGHVLVVSAFIVCYIGSEDRLGGAGAGDGDDVNDSVAE